MSGLRNSLRPLLFLYFYFMKHYHIHSLHYYPVKALGGHAVTAHQLGKRGFKDDRRWMFIDQTGRFMSQRKHRTMVNWRASIEGGKLSIVSLDGEQQFHVPAARTAIEQVEVTVWDDTFMADLIAVPDLQELTEAMGIPGARLIYLGEESRRPIDPRYAKEGEEVSFADGYPYLITNTASLNDFSARVGEDLAMSRFRPNIVIATDIPWTEDNWKQLSISGQPFRIPKPCARCQVITIDQQTGEQRMELLAELAKFRKEGNKVLFGMNGIWEGDGVAILQVGDEVIL